MIDADRRDTIAGGPLQSRLRLQTSIRLRWFAVAGQLLAVAFVYFYFGFSLPLGLCLVLIALSAWINVYLRMRFPPTHRLSPRLATLLLAYDLLQLGILLFLTGGIDNPFTVLIVAPVTVSAATLPARNTLLLGVLALAVTVTISIVHDPLPWHADGAFELPILYKFGAFWAVTSCLIFLGLYVWRLAKEANEMSTALAATELVLAREQKLHALDGLAAAAAHELGTPLATIVLVAGELQKDIGDEEAFRSDLKLLQDEAQRCRALLQKLTRDPAERDPLHASMSIREIADEASAPYEARGVDVRIIVAGAEDGSLEPVTERKPGVLFGVGNLIENAVDFARRQVAITVSWSAQSVTLTIADDGPGFPPAILDQIGDPYVSSRKAGPLNRSTRQRAGGLGLGMFIAKTLLERSGASVEASNRPAPESGAVVTVVWPRAAFMEGAIESGIAGQFAAWPKGMWAGG